MNGKYGPVYDQYSTTITIICTTVSMFHWNEGGMKQSESDYHILMYIHIKYIQLYTLYTHSSEVLVTNRIMG